MSEKLTMLEVLEDTVKYYSEDISRRAVYGLGRDCKYYIKGKDNIVKMCAVGRYLKDPILHKDDSNKGAAGFIDKYTMSVFKDSVSHISSIFFWNKLQVLHDSKINWAESGLTYEGLLQVEEIKREFKL